MTTSVCILTAGAGSRMGRYHNAINKALLPYKDKAAISNIISQFPDHYQFIIALGSQAEQVRNYLEIAHPEKYFIFVEVDRYQGKGSGPGYSLLCCRSVLKSSFYFVSCDTLWTDQIDWKYNCQSNWWALSYAKNTKSYCAVRDEKNLIVEVYDKYSSEEFKLKVFTGLAHIKDYIIFWNSLQISENIQGEKQISSGFKQLITDRKLKALDIEWIDLGTEENYISAISKEQNFDFSKSDEFIYFVNQNVIKFFKNDEVVQKRVNKSKLNQNVFPVVSDFRTSFYKYPYAKGEVLYKILNQKIFNELLIWLQSNLWTKKNISPLIADKKCTEFYFDKTIHRLKLMKEKYFNLDHIQKVNGSRVDSIEDLLSRIDFKLLSNADCYFIHGDLQPDNIIYNEQSYSFLLLDWRQDFSGETEYGDIYYDFAKLWAGLLMDYTQIKLDRFVYSEINEECKIEFKSVPQVTDYLVQLENFLTNHHFSVYKVKVLVGLIFLNMAPLHHKPFDLLLFHYSRKYLADLLGEKK